MRIHIHLMVRVVGPLLCLSAASAPAGNLEVEPGAAVNVVYVDNLNLTTQAEIERGDEKESDVLMQIIPGVSLTYESARARAELNYRYFYLHSFGDEVSDRQVENEGEVEQVDRDRGYHRLGFDSETELILDRVFLRANADFNQTVINPNDTVDTIFDSSGNLTDRGIYTLNPYWTQRFGGGVTGTLGYSRDAIRYDDDAIVDSDIDTLNAGFDTRGTQNRLSWTGSVVHEQVSYLPGEEGGGDSGQQSPASTPTIVSRDSELTAAYRMGAAFSLTATVGEERVEVTFDDRECVTDGEQDEFCELGDPYWLGGVAWAPSSRTTVEFGGGERFYGNTAYFRFNHDRPNRVWTMSYNEDVTTNARDQLDDLQLVRERDAGLPPDLAPSDDPDRRDINFQLPTLAVFLEKTATLAFVQRFTRAQVSLDLEWERREYLEQDDTQSDPAAVRLTGEQDEIISGELELNWQLGGRASWSVYYELDEIVSRPEGRDGNALFPGEGGPGDRFYEYGTGLRWQIRPQMDFNAFIRNRGRDDSVEPPSNGEEPAPENDYQQWLVGVGLDMRF